MLVIQWSRPGKGFGELTIRTRGGKLAIDAECMHRDTVMDILAQAVREADIDG